MLTLGVDRWYCRLCSIGTITYLTSLPIFNPLLTTLTNNWIIFLHLQFDYLFLTFFEYFWLLLLIWHVQT